MISEGRGPAPAFMMIFRPECCIIHIDMSGALTKKSIVSAYLKLLKTTPFSRISISEIAAEAGINRQTFYYHFHDIYDLSAYAFQIHAIEKLQGEREFSPCLVHLCQIMRDMGPIIQNVYHHAEYHDCKRIFISLMKPISSRLVEIASADAPLDKDGFDIAVQFTGIMTSEFILTWIEQGMPAVNKRFMQFSELMQSNFLNTIDFLRK